MRAQRTLLMFAGLTILAIIVIRATPIRYYVVHPRLTVTQRNILDQAEAGLAVYATRSAMARVLYVNARALTRRAAFIPGTGAFALDKRHAGPLSVAVNPDDQASNIATYDHVKDLLLFVEPKCEAMTHMTLGLVYGHELQHRHDFKAGVYRSGDTLGSVPRQMSELRARRTALRILSEYTAGRWDSAVVVHCTLYHRQRPRLQRLHPHGKIRFDTDVRWIRREFGRLTDSDLDYVVGLMWFDSALQLGLPDTVLTATDSLRYNLETLRSF